jgi:dihydrofolate reductase
MTDQTKTGATIANMSVSLDGYVNHPTDGVNSLFEWYSAGGEVERNYDPRFKFQLDENSAALLDEVVGSIGALVAGRRLFDETQGWGGHHPAGAPVVVLTHEPPEDWPEGTSIHFVTEGIEAAIARAKELADGKDVALASPTIMQQALAAGLLDVIAVDLVPVFLGTGVRWFDNLGTEPIRLGNPRVIPGNRVTHLQYPVLSE